MNDKDTHAIKRRLRRTWISPVWLVPLGAVLIGIWLAWRSFLSLGPEIVLELDTAEGLEAGKTAVKLRNVDVGVVRKVSLAGDYDSVRATIRMDPDAAPLLVEDTEFWVVKPRVGRRGISGLETIISGAYIQILPGNSREPARRFTVLERPPATLSGVPGLALVLVNDGSGALAIDDPLVYQGQTVGQVTSASFDPKTRTTRYDLLVESPYDKLITEHTQFWSRSGIDVQLDAQGVHVQFGSLQTLLTGGVTFGTPLSGRRGDSAENGDEYTLYSSSQAAEQARYDLRIEYLVLFEDSLGGLYDGAPVKYRGVRVGTVSKAPYFGEALQLDTLTDAAIPVLIRIEPQRVGGAWSEVPPDEWRRRLADQFDRGLRANISPANLLTGAEYVSLEFVDKAGAVDSKHLAGYPVFPSHGGGVAGLQSSLTALLDKFNALRIAPALEQLEATLASTDEVLQDARSTLKRIEGFFETESTRNLPAEVNATLRDLQETLSGYQRGQPVHESLLRNLNSLGRVLAHLESFSQTISDDPNALIFGKERPRRPGPHTVPR